jgi:hypothetical protein
MTQRILGFWAQGEGGFMAAAPSNRFKPRDSLCNLRASAFRFILKSRVVGRARSR